MSYDFSSFFDKADKALDYLKTDIASLRTGRANAQLLDPVMVEAYGTRMKLVEVASIQVPDANLIVVSPWDKGLIVSVEKAIASAELNLNPNVDGELIRIVIPSLTEETRKDMVKMLHKKVEASRVAIRSIRAEFKDEIEAQKAAGGVSEDEVARDLDQLEKEFKKVIDQVDQIATKKEEDLLRV